MKNFSLLIVYLSCLALVGTLAQGYDENLAIKLSYASGGAYCIPDSLLKSSCGKTCQRIKSAGFEPVHSDVLMNGKWTSEGYAFYYSASMNKIIIAFRGTMDTIQLLQEGIETFSASYQLQPNYPLVKIQAYFYNHYISTLRTGLISHISNLKTKYPRASFIFTGHSLGGAFATLASFDFVSQVLIRKEEMVVYTFGSPRVGNSVFSATYKDVGPKNYRVVNSMDIVPHFTLCLTGTEGKCINSSGVQTTQIWFPYHVDQEIWYPEKTMKPGTYQICYDEDRACSNRYLPIQCNVNDHRVYFGVLINCTD